MLLIPSVRSRAKLKWWVVPRSPAVPTNSARIDHRNAAVVPTETRVSMVAAPWRALIQAARWNGQPAHTTTGAARVREAKPQ